MKIKRAVYIETDIDGNNLEEFFLNSKQAQEYAGSQLTKTISDVLGSDYAIPAKDIDEDGYITHFSNGRKPEISSSQWGWSVYDGISDTVRASIKGIEIELTPEEVREAFLTEEKACFCEDAKHALYEFLKYEESPEEGSYWDARSAVVDNHMMETYGVSVQELVYRRSKYFILDNMVSMFERRQDANIDTWSVWEQIVRDVLDERKAAFSKENHESGPGRFAISADDGETWTEQWITCGEAVTERAKGRIVIRI